MSDMSVIEKAGMVVDAEGTIVMEWVDAGEEVELKEGDVVVSNAKAAAKHNIAEEFKAAKAVHTAKKEKPAVAEGEKPARAPRIEVPKEGTYSVLKAKAAELKEGEEPNERHNLLTKLFANTDFAEFWKDTPEKFSHPSRDGEMKEFATTGLVAYAIKRGMISVDPK